MATDALEAHISSSSSYSAGSSQSTAASLTGLVLSPTNGRYFTDQHGRRILLHGANVSGLNKLPSTPNSFTHLDLGEKYYDGENISFVGRPWPIEESHDHLTRLSQWGLTFIRLVVPWEALEHAGPGQYDEEYLDYLHQLVSLMPKYGIKAYIDAHQDVWSRHAGGSGAPLWTLTLAGFDVRNLKATGAAHAHNVHLSPSDPPPKVWPSGMTKLAAATMATIFWGGEVFAPLRRVRRRLHGGKWGQEGAEDEEVGLQVFLQESMAEAFGRLAERVRECEAVVGFEVINEPHRGYITLHSPYAWDFNTDLAIGYFPSAVQSWALGSGHAVVIPHYIPSFPVTAVSHHVLLQPPGGRTAWLPLPSSSPSTSSAPAEEKEKNPTARRLAPTRPENAGCPWAQHGLWAWSPSPASGENPAGGQPVVLKMEYFHRFAEETVIEGCRESEAGKDGRGGRRRKGEEVDWYRDFYFPFCRLFARRIQRWGRADDLSAPAHMQKWWNLVEPIPNEFAPPFPEPERPKNLVYAPHFYDLQALFEKRLGWMSANVQGLARGMFLLKALVSRSDQSLDAYSPSPVDSYFGRSGLKKNYALQIRNILTSSLRQIGEVPIVLGETGCPFDLNAGREFVRGRWKGSYQERMLDAICAAVGEEGLGCFNLWTYNPLNNDTWGDSWNGENFSWFSLSDISPERLERVEKEGGGEMERLNVGARCLDAVERPYAVKTAGIPLRAHYDFHTRSFSYSYINPIPSSSPLAGAVPATPQAEATVAAPPLVGLECAARETEVYLPRRRYGKAFREGRLRVKIREGDGEWKYDEERQTLYLLHTNTSPGFVHSLTLSVSGPLDRPPLRKWYEPPAWALQGVEQVWVHLALVCGTGLLFGLWLLWTWGIRPALFGEGEYVEGEWLAGEL
ncbi:hypothetical protein JCM8097_002319 [Rhodosporidiobolus ruineniae]